MQQLAWWKRAGAVVVLAAISVGLTAMGLQTIAVTCAPDKNGIVTCVHEVRYAGFTTSEATFTPALDRVSARQHGKGNSLGTVVIRPLDGGKLEIGWMTSGEATVAAAELVRDPHYAIESAGPRWWLLFLLLTIPFAISFIVPTKQDVPSVAAGMQALPQNKKAARAARGKQRKARERA